MGSWYLSRPAHPGVPYVLFPGPSLLCWCLLLFCRYPQIDCRLTLWKEDYHIQWMYDSNLWGTFLWRCWDNPAHCDDFWLLCGHLQALELYNHHELVSMWAASRSGMGGSLSSWIHTEPLRLPITLLWLWCHRSLYVWPEPFAQSSLPWYPHFRTLLLPTVV